MAYENMTYEYILKRMIDRVSGKYPTLDMREGSIVFNALASAAVEMAIMYWEVDNAQRESWVETASREYKLEACKEMGMDISVFEASFGTHKAEFNVEVPIGSRWNCDLYNYKISEYLGFENDYHCYKAVCETEGTAPNNLTGNLTAIDEIPNGLSYAKLTECLAEGENETPDEDIATAYYDYINSTIRDGNVDQYKHWCKTYVTKDGSSGIGNFKIFPLWDGANTVKVSILSASNGRASDELIEEFQEYLDPGITGMGDGVAPIGAFVTVSTAKEKEITISCDVTVTSNEVYESDMVKALREYLSTHSYVKDRIAYMNVGAVILGVKGVESINNLLINGGTSDITLGEEEIPILKDYEITKYDKDGNILEEDFVELPGFDIEES